LVAIARAVKEDLVYPAPLLVLAEPTATLPVEEANHLLDRVMAATGVGVLYVTHVTRQYAWDCPPSIGTTAPLMNAASSDCRKATRFATSSG
jgi:hypothetical protein